jgi:DNA-binding IclR family transcriptional regulator
MRQSETPRQKAGIQSVDKAFDVLGALVGAGRALRLTDIVERTGMPRNLVHAYLVSLQRVGAVVQDPMTARYDLGGTVARMGLAALSRQDFLAMAQAAMRALAEESGHSAWLSVWGEHGPVIVAKIEGAHASPFEIRIGSLVNLTMTSTGLTYIAHLPRVVWRDLFDKEQARLVAGAPGASQIDALLREIRTVGVASRAQIVTPQRDSVLPQFSSLAAPVFDHTGQIRAVLTLIGEHEVFDHSPAGAEARRLKAAAAVLSARLGYDAETAA